MSELGALFVSQRSAVVQACAGTGKMNSLVTLCLDLLGGIGLAEPLPAARLWAVTFTEKAAAELKGRIRQRIDALAECAPEEVARIEPSVSTLALSSTQSSALNQKNLSRHGVASTNANASCPS